MIQNSNAEWELIDDCGERYFDLREIYTDKTDEWVKTYNDYCDLYSDIMEKIEHQ